VINRFSNSILLHSPAGRLALVCAARLTPSLTRPWLTGRCVERQGIELTAQIEMTTDRSLAGSQLVSRSCFANDNPHDRQSGTYFRLAADQTLAGTQCHYKASYDSYFANGNGVRQNAIESARFFKWAADQNQAEAQCLYGWCLATGNGVQQDLIASAKYFKLAADQNSAEAQLRYGFVLLFGDGVRQDLTESAKYFKLGADQNRAEAQCQYGWCLANGIGIRRDLIACAKYFKLAADQN
jgi:TPR repeat protein